MVAPKSKEKAPAPKKYRNFATVVYPESAPDGWEAILSDTHIPAFISPLHDKDINPNSEPKKPHFHIMLMYDAPHLKESATEVFMSIGGVGTEVVNNLRGYARYLCHLDNPEKAQYDSQNVISLSGSDYSQTIGLPSDKYKAIGEMIDWCIETDTVMYWELLQYSRQYRYDWFRVLCDNGTMVMMNFLKSREYSRNGGDKA